MNCFDPLKGQYKASKNEVGLQAVPCPSGKPVPQFHPDPPRAGQGSVMRGAQSRVPQGMRLGQSDQPLGDHWETGCSLGCM